MLSRPVSCYRYFFALPVPPEVCADIAEMLEGRFPLSRRVTGDRLHVPLAILDDLKGRRPDVAEALADIGRRFKPQPVRLAFDRLAVAKDQVLLVSTEPMPVLLTVQAQLQLAMQKAGFARRKQWRFSPQISLATRQGRGHCNWIEPVSWQASELLLIQNQLGAARHHVLARWRF
ncbi:MAG: hypothetical protein RL367_1156 [Pseudomonadota bacterium]